MKLNNYYANSIACAKILPGFHEIAVVILWLLLYYKPTHYVVNEVTLLHHFLFSVTQYDVVLFIV